MRQVLSLIARIKRATLKFLLWEGYWTFRFVSLKKASNLLQLNFEKKISRSKVLSAFPTKLTIDPTDICQLHCPLCPTGQGNPARLRGAMNFDNFRKLIDEVGQYLFEIDLFNWGEPFLNKDIFKIIEYVARNNVKTRVSSNLNYFPSGFEKELVASRLHHLVVSLDGTTQESYGQYRVGGSLVNVVAAVSRIAEEKKRQKSPFPFLTWQFIVMRHNETEIEAAKKLVKKWGFDRIVFARNRGDMGRELFESNRSKEYKATTCYRPWQEAVVNWNGSVSPCCLFYDEHFDFGNVFTDGFKSVWNNEKYRQARGLIKSGKAEDKTLVCWQCLRNGFPE